MTEKERTVAWFKWAHDSIVDGSCPTCVIEDLGKGIWDQINDDIGPEAPLTLRRYCK